MSMLENSVLKVEDASKTVTGTPFCARLAAAQSPTGPAPTTYTRSSRVILHTLSSDFGCAKPVAGKAASWPSRSELSLSKRSATLQTFQPTAYPAEILRNISARHSPALTGSKRGSTPTSRQVGTHSIVKSGSGTAKNVSERRSTFCAACCSGTTTRWTVDFQRSLVHIFITSPRFTMNTSSLGTMSSQFPSPCCN